MNVTDILNLNLSVMEFPTQIIYGLKYGDFRYNLNKNKTEAHILSHGKYCLFMDFGQGMILHKKFLEDES